MEAREEAGGGPGGASLYGTTQERCEQMIDHAIAKSPMVKFVVAAMEKAGCAVGRGFFRAEVCDLDAGGGFRPEAGVVVCSNHVLYQDEVDTALAHELIHAYDFCRAANLDWANCLHHACSEIRAANLSGDCHYKREMLRGNTRMRGQHQICVKRRAQLSVAMNSNCEARAAHDAVEAAWPTCYKDTAPFDQIP
eukprot:SM000111S18773  [mRNA]  locus=s111:13144:14977:- [translate_table: standard]